MDRHLLYNNLQLVLCFHCLIIRINPVNSSHRSLKYGKLSQGTLVKVSPSLVKRRKTHFHKLPCGASVILGNNGFVWVSPTQHEEQGHTRLNRFIMIRIQNQSAFLNLFQYLV